MDREDATQVEAPIQHDLGTRSPAQALELILDQLVTKPERENDFIDAGISQQMKMSFESQSACAPSRTAPRIVIARESFHS